MSRIAGHICNEHGNDLPPHMPPPPQDNNGGPEDWTLYNDSIKFECTEFLYTCEQKPGGNINILLSLWAASLVAHNNSPPFSKNKDMYSAIDPNPLSGIPWECHDLFPMLSPIYSPIFRPRHHHLTNTFQNFPNLIGPTYQS